MALILIFYLAICSSAYHPNYSTSSTFEPCSRWFYILNFFTIASFAQVSDCFPFEDSRERMRQAALRRLEQKQEIIPMTISEPEQQPEPEVAPVQQALEPQNQETRNLLANASLRRLEVCPLAVKSICFKPSGNDNLLFLKKKKKKKKKKKTDRNLTPKFEAGQDSKSPSNPLNLSLLNLSAVLCSYFFAFNFFFFFFSVRKLS